MDPPKDQSPSTPSPTNKDNEINPFFKKSPKGPGTQGKRLPGARRKPEVLNHQNFHKFTRPKEASGSREGLEGSEGLELYESPSEGISGTDYESHEDSDVLTPLSSDLHGSANQDVYWQDWVIDMIDNDGYNTEDEEDLLVRIYQGVTTVMIEAGLLDITSTSGGRTIEFKDPRRKKVELKKRFMKDTEASKKRRKPTREMSHVKRLPRLRRPSFPPEESKFSRPSTAGSDRRGSVVDVGTSVTPGLRTPNPAGTPKRKHSLVKKEETSELESHFNHFQQKKEQYAQEDPNKMLQKLQKLDTHQLGNARDEGTGKTNNVSLATRNIHNVSEALYENEIEEEQLKREDNDKKMAEGQNEVTKRVQNLERKLEEARLEKLKMQENLDALKRNAKAANDDDRKDKEIEHLEGVLKDKIVRIAALEKQLADAKSEKERLAKEAADVQKDYNGRIKALQQDLINIRSQKSSTAKIYPTNEEEKTALEKNLGSTTKAKALLEKKENELQAIIQDLKKQMNSTSELYEKERTRKSKAEAELAKLEKDNMKLQQEKKVLEQSYFSNQENATDIAEQASINKLQYDIGVDKLRFDIDVINDAISKNKVDMHECLQILDVDPSDSPDIITLRTSMRKMLEHYNPSLHQIQNHIDNYNNNITTTMSSIRTLKQKMDKLTYDEPNPQDEYKTLFALAGKKYDQVKTQFDIMREENKKLLLLSPMGVTRENLHLKDKLSEADSQTQFLDAELAKSRETVKQWKKEYEAVEKRADARHAGYTSDLANQVQEIQKHVKAYDDRMPDTDPEWWHIQGLRKKVEQGEKVCEDLKSRLAQVKTERQTAYNQIQKLVEENKVFKQTNAMFPPSSGHHNGGKNHPKTYSFWLPTPVEMEKRKAEIEAFKEQRRRAREKQDLRFEVMEEVRRWRMGKHWPPGKRRRWSSVVEKSMWDRWGGDEWLQIGVDKDDVEKVKRSGICER
jgi:DNA repair exonuclease SbcCD ATPase subunit